MAKMKFTTQRDRADEEVEKLKSALKLTGLDYFLEESPFRLSIHVKKTYIKDFSPRLSEDLPWQPNFTSSPHPVIENDSGLPSQELSCCSSCPNKEKLLNDVRSELVKVIVDSNENREKLSNELEMSNLALLKANEKLKRVQDEAVHLKEEIKTKIEQLKQKNKNYESLKTKLDKSTKDYETSKDNLNNQVANPTTQNGHLKTKIEELKTDIKKLKSKKNNTTSQMTQTEENKPRRLKLVLLKWLTKIPKPF